MCSRNENEERKLGKTPTHTAWLLCDLRAQHPQVLSFSTMLRGIASAGAKRCPAAEPNAGGSDLDDVMLYPAKLLTHSSG